MTGIADRRGCFGQATATGSLKIVNRPLQFDGLAEYVLKKVGHGQSAGNRFWRSLSWPSF
jgi:hypothetical protein